MVTINKTFQLVMTQIQFTTPHLPPIVHGNNFGTFHKWEMAFFCHVALELQHVLNILIFMLKVMRQVGKVSCWKGLHWHVYLNMGQGQFILGASQLKRPFIHIWPLPHFHSYPQSNFLAYKKIYYGLISSIWNFSRVLLAFQVKILEPTMTYISIMLIIHPNPIL